MHGHRATAAVLHVPPVSPPTSSRPAPATNRASRRDRHSAAGRPGAARAGVRRPPCSAAAGRHSCPAMQARAATSAWRINAHPARGGTDARFRGQQRTRCRPSDADHCGVRRRCRPAWSTRPRPPRCPGPGPTDGARGLRPAAARGVRRACRPVAAAPATRSGPGERPSRPSRPSGAVAGGGRASAASRAGRRRVGRPPQRPGRRWRRRPQLDRGGSVHRAETALPRPRRSTGNANTTSPRPRRRGGGQGPAESLEQQRMHLAAEGRHRAGPRRRPHGAARRPTAMIDARRALETAEEQVRSRNDPE